MVECHYDAFCSFLSLVRMTHTVLKKTKPFPVFSPANDESTDPDGVTLDVPVECLFGIRIESNDLEGNGRYK